MALTFGPRAVPLSVLDLAPVPDGGTAGDALRATTDLARHAERLGVRRFWVAEHHNMPGIASSAPPVLIGHIADATTTMRVGSGGVMLPNHVSLVVAEQFGMLEALHPGRIDLGIGRAPGTDQVTAAALRRSPEGLSADDFPDQLMDLLGFFTGRWPENHPFAQITAMPGRGNQPDMWLLGSSGYSAQVAGLLGLPFAFAHHFSAANTLPALALYRQHFRPSPALDRPYAMVAAAVVCAETDERARWLAGEAAAGPGDPDVVFCLDEFGPLNLQPRPGRQWAHRGGTARDPGEGPRRRLRATYHRTSGVRHLFAALELGSDTMYGHIKKRKRRGEFLQFCRHLRSLHPPQVRIAVVCDNFSPHLTTRKDKRVGQWAAASNAEIAYTPTNSSWMNRLECQFTALREFTLNDTDHATHREQGSMIRRYIAWRNRHTRDPRLPRIVKRASAA